MDGGRNERVLQIGEQVRDRLDADGETDEIRRRGERGRSGGRVRHPRGDLDQALDAAERLRKLEDLRSRDELDRLFLGLREERDHPTEVAHLPRRKRVVRVRGQPGIEHTLDEVVALEPERDLHCVFAVR